MNKRATNDCILEPGQLCKFTEHKMHNFRNMRQQRKSNGPGDERLEVGVTGGKEGGGGCIQGHFVENRSSGWTQARAHDDCSEALNGKL